eukprot:m.239475 g.239475  ORF g.239475 m.239475 type:complete len:459 (-) comp33745_c5_seq3:1031-2407(-)
MIKIIGSVTLLLVLSVSQSNSFTFHGDKPHDVDRVRLGQELLRFRNEALNDVPRFTTQSLLGPMLPGKWNATGDSIMTFNNVSMQTVVAFGSNVTMMSDNTLNRSAQVGVNAFKWGPEAFHKAGNSSIEQVTLATKQYSLMQLNGAKYIQSAAGGFSNIFSWTPAAHSTGIVMWNHMNLTRWVFALPTNGNASWELFMKADGTPARMEFNFTIPKTDPGGYGGKRLHELYTFTTFNADASMMPDPFAGFDINDYLHPMKCDPEPEPVKNMTIFIFHPKNEFDIAGQDVGDAVGDTFFTCVDLLLSQPGMIDHDYQWITQWTIEFFTTIGEYQNCNGYNPPNCFGTENFYVGHAAGQNLGRPTLGQCHSNPLTGEWYSLPVGGECKDSQVPDGKTCTWRKTRVKTLDSQCLFELHRFRDVCEIEGEAPFSTAVNAFNQAFASTNVTAGGCPAITPTTLL